MIKPALEMMPDKIFRVGAETAVVEVIFSAERHQHYVAPFLVGIKTRTGHFLETYVEHADIAGLVAWLTARLAEPREPRVPR